MGIFLQGGRHEVHNPFILISLLGNQAHAHQLPCYEKEPVTRNLLTKFKESLDIAVLTANGLNYIELWINNTTETWTLVLVLPSGAGCLLSNGTGYIRGVPTKGEADG
jgi:hypothetical protein